MVKINYTYTRDAAVHAFRYIEDYLTPDAPQEQIMEQLRRTCLDVAHNIRDATNDEKTFKTSD